MPIEPNEQNGDVKENTIMTTANQARTNDINDVDWIRNELLELPVWERNNDLCLLVLNKILPCWQDDYNGTNKNYITKEYIDGSESCVGDDHRRRSYPRDRLNGPWRKIVSKFSKEFNETEPCIQYIRNVVDDDSSPLRKFTIVDLGSGFGLCSMLLSELLPPEKVNAIWLLDKSWPLYNNKGNNNNETQTTGVTSSSTAGTTTEMDNEKNKRGNENIKTNMTTNHIHQRSWPIPLFLRKINLKKSREIQQLFDYGIVGPKRTTQQGNRHDENQQHQYKISATTMNDLDHIIFVGIHLCKALSVHAIQLYQSCLASHSLILKPCCLPGANRLYYPTTKMKEPIVYSFSNQYTFRPLDLYCVETTTKATNDGGKSQRDNGKNNNNEMHRQEKIRVRQHLQACATGKQRKLQQENERFSKWVHLLAKGAAADGRTSVKVETIQIQRHHFQNQFIFCRNDN